jgi:hypothetical protein
MWKERPSNLALEQTLVSLVSLAREEAAASVLAGTRVTIGEGVPDLLETSLPSSAGQGRVRRGGGREEGRLHSASSDDGDNCRLRLTTTVLVEPLISRTLGRRLATFGTARPAATKD